MASSRIGNVRSGGDRRIMATTESRWADPDGVVYVVDDETCVRRALARLLSAVGLNVESFSSVEAFLEHGLPDHPCCLLLDVYLGAGRSGLDLQAELGDKQEMIPIIFITGTGDVEASVRAMKAGALDFMEKPLDGDALHSNVRAALTRSREALQAVSERGAVWSRLALLTPRERQTLEEMAQGKSNAAIAQALFITEHSVEKVIHSIFLKLGLTWEPAVHKRVKAVVLYLAESS